MRCLQARWEQAQRLHAADRSLWPDNTIQDLPGEVGDSATELISSPPIGQAGGPTPIGATSVRLEAGASAAASPGAGVVSV
jgi:hypothetical protein